jgi:hypothetical protein
MQPAHQFPTSWAPSVTKVVSMTSGTFEYTYDNYAEREATGAVERDAGTESRLVHAIGIARVNVARRDDGRLSGWVGPTFGPGWDKGHFIAHRSAARWTGGR